VFAGKASRSTHLILEVIDNFARHGTVRLLIIDCFPEDLCPLIGRYYRRRFELGQFLLMDLVLRV